MEVTTFLTIIQGVDTLVTMVRVCSRYHLMYTEAAHKIQTHAFKAVVGAQLAKKIQSKQQMRLLSFVSDFVKAVDVMHLERNDAYRVRQEERLATARRERALKKDKEDELKLHSMGFLRDKLSKLYIQPDTLLQLIIDALKVKLAEHPERNAVVALVGNLDQQDPDAFKPYQSHFYWIEVLCPVTQRPFECNMLEDSVFSPTTICMLKKAIQAMVYVDLRVLHHEHEIMSLEQ